MHDIQPVKVVSSMGQQSVGKSFSLNHLLDTSFAGSAMRTTGIHQEKPNRQICISQV
jgi:hypothetical protein